MVHPVVVLFHVKHLPCQPAVSRETPLIRCSGLRRPLRAEAACRPVSDPDKGWPCRLRSCVVPAGGWKHIHAVVQIDGHECLALQGVVCCRAHGSTGRFGYGDRLPGRPVGGRRIGGRPRFGSAGTRRRWWRREQPSAQPGSHKPGTARACLHCKASRFLVDSPDSDITLIVEVYDLSSAVSSVTRGIASGFSVRRRADPPIPYLSDRSRHRFE